MKLFPTRSELTVEPEFHEWVEEVTDQLKDADHITLKRVPTDPKMYQRLKKELRKANWKLERNWIAPATRPNYCGISAIIFLAIVGVANKPIQMIEHLVHHIAHCLQERPKVTFKELKQIATSTNLTKFQDSQTAFMMWKCLAPLKVRNSFRAEVGLPSISPEEEFYWNPVFGGFKSVLAWNRYNNSPERLAEFIKKPLPDDHLVFLA